MNGSANRPLFGAPFMTRAIELARRAAVIGEVPVGAVVVADGIIVGEGHNLTRSGPDPTAHAEMVALRDAARNLSRERLDNCALWVTLEPCAMCAGAIAHSRIARLYYAAPDPKGGAVENGARLFSLSETSHRPEIYSGMGEAEAASILHEFFKARR